MLYRPFEPVHEISNNVVCATSQASESAYAQSDQSLCQSLAYFTTVKLLTEHHLEFLSLKGGGIGSYESTLIKMPHCLKSHVMAHMLAVHYFPTRPRRQGKQDCRQSELSRPIPRNSVESDHG